MPAAKNGSSDFVKEWKSTLRQAQEVGIKSRELNEAGISRRTFQRNKNRPDGPLETKATREIIDRLKPLIAIKAEALAEKGRRVARLAKQNRAELVWGAVVIGTAAAVAGGWLCFCDDFGFGLTSGLGLLT